MEAKGSLMRSLRGRARAAGFGLWMWAEGLALMGMIALAFVIEITLMALWGAARMAFRRMGAWGKRQDKAIGDALESGPGRHWKAARDAPWELSWAGAMKLEGLLKSYLSGQRLALWMAMAASRALRRRPELGRAAARAGANPLMLIDAEFGEDLTLFGQTATPWAGEHWGAPIGWVGALRSLCSKTVSAREVIQRDREGDPELARFLALMDAALGAQQERQELGEVCAPVERKRPGGRLL